MSRQGSLGQVSPVRVGNRRVRTTAVPVRAGQKETGRQCPVFLVSPCSVSLVVLLTTSGRAPLNAPHGAVAGQVVPNLPGLGWELSLPPVPKTGYPTSIRLPTQVRAILEREARKREWSLTMLISEILRQWVESHLK